MPCNTANVNHACIPNPAFVDYTPSKKAADKTVLIPA